LGSLPSAFLRSIKIPNPNFKGNPPFFIGSQWVALSKSTCQLLLDNSKSLKSEFRFAFCPDEIAFQSLYGRNNNTEIRNNKVNESSFDSVIEADFHLIHPSLNHFWDIWEFDYVIKSPKFFIRKPSWELLLKLNATAITE
jgi:hypothetical protein